MKKLISFLFVLSLSTTGFGQSTPGSAPLTKADYLQKSKSQKTAGWVLLGAGATTLVIISTGNTDLGSLGPLAVGGAAAVLGSIPLFLASGKNKRKAKSMSASIRLENADIIQGYSKVQISYPAFSVKFNLR